VTLGDVRQTRSRRTTAPPRTSLGRSSQRSPTAERRPRPPELRRWGSYSVPYASANRTVYALDPGAGLGATRNCPDVVVRDLTELSTGGPIPLGAPGGREPRSAQCPEPRGTGDGAHQSRRSSLVTIRVKECPGPEPIYLGRDFESPELVFVRALDVDA
jgi:hypothetical protein